MLGGIRGNNENDILICFVGFSIVDRGVVRMEVHESRGTERKKDGDRRKVD
jgi:hypothetical protein